MRFVRDTIKFELNIADMEESLSYSLDSWKVDFYFDEAIYVAIEISSSWDWGYEPKIKTLHVDISTENNASNTDCISRSNYITGEKVELIKRNKVTNNIVILIDIIFDDFYAPYLHVKKLSDPQRSRLDEFGDFEKMLSCEKFSDVIINVSDKTFHAHKNILTCKSTVFEAMFKHEMKENKENVVNIDDVDPKVFMEMLRFIYVAKVENLDEVADDLLPLANMYDLNGLKNLCGKCMSEKLSVDNVFQYIKLAMLYDVTNLKEEAVKFIKLNRLKLNTLQNTAMEETFKNIDPIVVCEIIRALTSP